MICFASVGILGLGRKPSCKQSRKPNKSNQGKGLRPRKQITQTKTQTTTQTIVQAKFV
jgi:hypothetical protein